MVNWKWVFFKMSKKCSSYVKAKKIDKIKQLPATSQHKWTQLQEYAISQIKQYN